MNQAVTAERYPLPPEDLRWRASGMRDAESFIRSSSVDVDFFDKEALGSERKSFRDFSSILDFGCGCGRLIRSLRPHCDQWASIHGVDIDAAAIAWCKQNIPDAKFAVNGEHPPLPYPDKSIDLIYACSVFSHFDAERQTRWLAELQRITKPGGYLLLTFRHEHSVEQIADQALQERVRAKLSSSGTAFTTSNLWKGAFPDWYGDAYHSPEYIRRNWGSYFEVCHIIPAGALPQETAVLRVRESTFLQRLFQPH